MAADIIRVVLTEWQNVIRANLKATLEDTRDIRIVGEATTARDAERAVELFKPDVLVMDMSMPDVDGTATCTTIFKKGPPTRVLATTTHVDEDYFLTVLNAGAAGCLTKHAALFELPEAVRAVANGDRYVGSRPAHILPAANRSGDPDKQLRDKFERLSPRERRVLLLVGQGFSSPEVGERLCISAKTVDTYKLRIQQKVGLMHRSEYIQFAFNMGVLKQQWWL